MSTSTHALVNLVLLGRGRPSPAAWPILASSLAPDARIALSLLAACYLVGLGAMAWRAASGRTLADFE